MDEFDGLGIHNPMESDDDPVTADALAELLFTDTVRSAQDTITGVQAAALITDKRAKLQKLLDTQDAVIHALMNVHSLIHIEQRS